MMRVRPLLVFISAGAAPQAYYRYFIALHPDGQRIDIAVGFWQEFLRFSFFGVFIV